MFELEEEIVHASKCARGADVAPTLGNSLAISAIHRTGVLRVTVKLVRRKYDEYRGVDGDPNEASRRTGDDGVNLDALLEQELL